MTRPRNQARPKKPANFPLTPHACGQWCKKIGGKCYFFGKWSDPDVALEEYRHDFPYLNLGRQPPTDCLTLADVLNAFVDDKNELRDAGRINARTQSEYIAMCHIIAPPSGAGTESRARSGTSSW